MKGLTGLIQANDRVYGSVLLSGQDVIKGDPTDALLPIGYCPQRDVDWKGKGKEILRPELTVM